MTRARPSSSRGGGAILLTARLRLEALGPRHAAPMLAGLSDERLYQFIGDRPPTGLGALRARYRRLATRRSPDGGEEWLNWALWSLGERRYLGYVQATVRRDRSADIGYVLFYDAWGHGYGREAVSAMLAHLGARHGVETVDARVDTRNHRSIGLVEALGFRLVAVRPAAEWIGGVLTDEAEYRLLLKERRAGT